MSQPTKTSEEYAANGGKQCPFCCGTQLTGEEVNIEEGVATQAITCLDCDSWWTDTYKLTGYIHEPWNES